MPPTERGVIERGGLAWGKLFGQQLQFSRPFDRLRTMMGIEPSINMLEVPFDRTDCDHHLAGHLLIREARCDQPERLDLALAEQIGSWMR